MPEAFKIIDENDWHAMWDIHDQIKRKLASRLSPQIAKQVIDAIDALHYAEDYILEAAEEIDAENEAEEEREARLELEHQRQESWEGYFV